MGLRRAANENELAGFWEVSRMNAIDRPTGEDEIFARWFFGKIVGWRDAEIEAAQGQARAHEHNALGLVFSREAKQGKVRGMPRGDDEIGLRKTSALRQCGTNAAKKAALPYDGNLMDLTSHTPLHRLGKTKRLVFMAGLAVTDQPKSE
jgi:hypothetical protein